MYSLVVAILALALTVVMLGSMLFHGGDTYTEAQAQAVAVGLTNEGAQIQVAYRTNMSLGSREHATVNELVTAGYLKSTPPFYDVDWHWDVYAAGTQPGFAGPVMLSHAVTQMAANDADLKVCNALEKMAHRPEKADIMGFPAAVEGELPGRYGCMHDGTLTIYYKL